VHKKILILQVFAAKYARSREKQGEKYVNSAIIIPHRLQGYEKSITFACGITI
jgi:hypothetical protein